MRFRDVAADGTGTFCAWEAYATTRLWTLGEEEGLKTVEVQFRDAVGNAGGASAQIVLDQTAPEILSFSVNDDAPYAAPGVPLTLALATRDSPGGSGVADVRASLNGGSLSRFASLAGLKVSCPVRPIRRTTGPGFCQPGTLGFCALIQNWICFFPEKFHPASAVAGKMAVA